MVENPALCKIPATELEQEKKLLPAPKRLNMVCRELVLPVKTSVMTDYEVIGHAQDYTHTCGTLFAVAENHGVLVPSASYGVKVEYHHTTSKCHEKTHEVIVQTLFLCTDHIL